jgi:hypothetical protein
MTGKMTPGAFGPWFCTLFFNTADNSKKQTHLIAHTFPHVACDMLNRTGASSNDHWVILLKIGPFESWNIAIAFLELWMSRKRGKQRRLERGIELFATYRAAYNLVLWSQAHAKDDQPVASGPSADDDNDDLGEDEPLTPPTAVKRHKPEPPAENPLKGIRQSFGAPLSMHGLTAICNQLSIAGIK